MKREEAKTRSSRLRIPIHVPLRVLWFLRLRSATVHPSGRISVSSLHAVVRARSSPAQPPSLRPSCKHFRSARPKPRDYFPVTNHGISEENAEKIHIRISQERPRHSHLSRLSCVSWTPPFPSPDSSHPSPYTSCAKNPLTSSRLRVFAFNSLALAWRRRSALSA